MAQGRYGDGSLAPVAGKTYVAMFKTTHLKVVGRFTIKLQQYDEHGRFKIIFKNGSTLIATWEMFDDEYIKLEKIVEDKNA